MNYKTFMDDLIYRIDEYNDSFKSPEEPTRFPIKQRETWAPRERHKAITQRTIGCDSENCLRLLEEFGFDGDPVSSQTASTVRKWFESTNGHIFPPRQDVLRLGLFFCLDFYETLHFVLKADFEKYLVENDTNWSYLCGRPFIDIIADYNSENKGGELAGMIEAFKQKLDKESLYWLFEKHSRMASGNGYNRKNFYTLIDDLFLERLFCYENSSQKIKNFAAYEQKLIEQAKYGSPEEQDVLWHSRSIWQLLLDELDELYVDIENTRLKNAEVDQEYLRQFGDVIITQTELETEIKLLEMRIGLMRIHPDISEEELEQKIQETQEKLQREIDELKLRNAIALDQACEEAWKRMGIPISKDALDDERELCKREIRAIRKLVHPDILMNNKEYQNLSEEQKKELEEILLDALKISPAEMGYPPNFAYHDMRSLEGLRQVRRRIETILKMNNIQVDLQYQLQGETIVEQIEWLEREIRLLENQINAAKGQLTAMLTDNNIQSKKMLLSNIERQKQFKEQMEERNAFLQSKRDLLLKEIETL